jgi:hypothetical protein
MMSKTLSVIKRTINESFSGKRLGEGYFKDKDIEDKEVENNPGMRSPRKPSLPFDGPYKKKPSAKPGKHGIGFSTAKHLAKLGMKSATKDMGEGWDDMLKAAKERKDDQDRKTTTKTGHDVKKTSTGAVYTKKYDKKSGLSEAENTDTPGNATHQCAVHVKSEQFGEGRTLTSQHAEPDAKGQIAWYDVMFDEGIKRVETKDLEILVSESHMSHKKKGK